MKQHFEVVLSEFYKVPFLKMLSWCWKDILELFWQCEVSINNWLKKIHKSCHVWFMHGTVYISIQGCNSNRGLPTTSRSGGTLGCIHCLYSPWKTHILHVVLQYIQKIDSADKCTCMYIVGTLEGVYVPYLDKAWKQFESPHILPTYLLFQRMTHYTMYIKITTIN